MLEIEKLTSYDDMQSVDKETFVDFMFTHLGEYGDPKKEIGKCLDYAFSKEKSEGGFALAAFNDGKLVGGLIMNRTGMANYIPDWVLVFVAVASSCRGKGYGARMIKEAIKHCDGDIKLHVEYDNPAKRLYERIGFNSRYAEMRFKNK
ncbi:MAG: GNAT family N-acetyltransferase [Bacteroidales bacterium]|nr:GNAT family N-acetyltransferase [Bacteroidales bacterium]